MTIPSAKLDNSFEEEEDAEEDAESEVASPTIDLGVGPVEDVTLTVDGARI